MGVLGLSQYSDKNLLSKTDNKFLFFVIKNDPILIIENKLQQ